MGILDKILGKSAALDDPTPFEAQPDGKPKDGRPMQRLQLDFAAQSWDRLNALVFLTDAESSAVVIRDALRLYDYVLQQRAEVWALHLVKDEAAKEIVLEPGVK